MFGWFKSKPQKSAKEEAAFEKGRQIATDMANDLDEFMRLRFNPARDALMGVIRERLSGCFEAVDLPPLIAARAEFDIFLEQVNDLRPRMLEEIDEHMKQWAEIMKIMEMQSVLDELIEQRVSSFKTGLTNDALQLLLDLTDRLKVADDAWREANPALSDQMPRAS